MLQKLTFCFKICCLITPVQHQLLFSITQTLQLVQAEKTKETKVHGWKGRMYMSPKADTEWLSQ